MKDFSTLVDNLYYINSSKAKSTLIREYLKHTPDPDRGWAIAAIAGTLSFSLFTRRTIKDLIVDRIDPTLFELSYDYVGEMSETVAHLWSTTITAHDNGELAGAELPSLHEVVTQFSRLPKSKIKPYLISLLNMMNPSQRWALLKLGTRGLRIGVSARFMKKVLAEYGAQQNTAISVEDIERLWHGVEPPYTELLAWLDNKASIPDISNKLSFQPVMLSHPLDEAALVNIKPSEWQVEWKFDGIRAQLVSNHTGIALFSRNGDNISDSFPDFLNQVKHANLIGRYDGELVALNTQQVSTHKHHMTQDYQQIGSFNQLQQRLNKKKPSKTLMRAVPVGLIIYDALEIGQYDIRSNTLEQRSEKVNAVFERHAKQGNEVSLATCNLFLSQKLEFASGCDLVALKSRAASLANGFIEGIMIKRKGSDYVAGRPKGQWYKLKRDAKLIDAVMMYAQRGHGKRSSFYSDFTFGCWQEGELLPIGKAYSGFTDHELKKLDAWVRRNTIGRFGPVKELKKDLVLEIAFDAVAPSNRHKSKVALRFPRIHRIRWDKPANEADQLATLIKMIE